MDIYVTKVSFILEVKQTGFENFFLLTFVKGSAKKGLTAKCNYNQFYIFKFYSVFYLLLTAGWIINCFSSHVKRIRSMTLWLKDIKARSF